MKMLLFPLKMPHWVADSLLADGSVKDWRHPNATYLPDHVLFLSNWTGWGTMSLTGGVGDDMRKFLEAAQEDAEGHEDRARNGDLKHRWRRFGPGWWWSNWGRSAILTAKASLSSFFWSSLTHLCQHRYGSKAKRMWIIIPQDLTGSHRSDPTPSHCLWPWILFFRSLRSSLKVMTCGPFCGKHRTLQRLGGFAGMINYVHCPSTWWVGKIWICCKKWNMYEYVHRFYNILHIVLTTSKCFFL
jgi:hypothetical protein